jgi:membrane-associated phospholipid phosphatase
VVGAPRAWKALLVRSLVLCAAFVALGIYVVRLGEPPVLAGLEHAMVGQATGLAIVLTSMCYAYVLGPLGLVLLLAAWRYPQWRRPILFSLVSLLASWMVADLFQHTFQRPRRTDWIVKHETSFSYPSSHAAIAFGFYALWAALVQYSRLPASARITISALLLVLTLAICWSRLALGAHYVTDLAGGAFLGLAVAGVAGAWATRR